MNYPPGVTGNEFQIAGADEFTAEREVTCWNEACRMFEKKQTLELELQAYGYEEWADFTCPDCGTEETYEGRVE